VLELAAALGGFVFLRRRWRFVGECVQRFDVEILYVALACVVGATVECRPLAGAFGMVR
jgi:hypothetical protein